MDAIEFAARIVRGFLVPAIEADDYRRRWKLVNRAAGALAAYNLLATEPQAIYRVFDAIAADIAREQYPDPEIVSMVLGPNGLTKRLTDCINRLAGEA